jgi:diphosphomevalonate decarboxylase
MSALTATAIAHPNIAFIKYWGNRDSDLRIPSNSSISMNLDGLFSHTRVTFDPTLNRDEMNLNGELASTLALSRAGIILNRVREMAEIKDRAFIESYNNFPTGTGIASSASGFAALALASSHAAGLDLDERDLSRLARTASGSACRSIPGGFVEWQAGTNDLDSYAVSIAPAEYWDLIDCIAIVSHTHKFTTSLEGHLQAETSPLQAARVEGTPLRLEICRDAILNRDFTILAKVIELDSNMMHAVMMTSNPPLLYWQPGTIRVMKAVLTWREEGLPVCYTIDAGPNVHVICPADVSSLIVSRLEQIDDVQQVMTARPGGPAKLAAQPD